jgi:hypothetical protein
MVLPGYLLVPEIRPEEASKVLCCKTGILIITIVITFIVLI